MVARRTSNFVEINEPSVGGNLLACKNRLLYSNIVDCGSFSESQSSWRAQCTVL